MQKVNKLLIKYNECEDEKKRARIYLDLLYLYEKNRDLLTRKFIVIEKN